MTVSMVWYAGPMGLVVGFVGYRDTELLRLSWYMYITVLSNGQLGLLGWTDRTDKTGRTTSTWANVFLRAMCIKCSVGYCLVKQTTSIWLHVQSGPGENKRPL